MSDFDQEPRPQRNWSGALGSLCTYLILGLVVAWFVVPKFYLTPHQLYHRVWKDTAENIFDPAVLGDWKAWEHKFDADIKTHDDAVKYANQMLKSLNDRYTYLLSKRDVSREDERQRGNFSGVGVVFDVQFDTNGKAVEDAAGEVLPATDANKYPLVRKVLKNSPAEGQGLKAGDAIVSIDGKDTAGHSLDWLVKQVRGQDGTPVTFVVRRNGQDQTMSIVRGKVHVPSVSTTLLPGDIGYIRLENFEQDNALPDMIRGLQDLSKAKAIILDLRGNPGGFVHNAINISSLFIEQGKIVVMKSRITSAPDDPHYKITTVTVTSTQLQGVTNSTNETKPEIQSGQRAPYMLNKRPLVILVDGNSASASEMTTGAIRDNGVAIVIGTKTFGKGIGQSSLSLPNGVRLHITSLRYFTPNGTWLGDGGNTVSHGIVPDVLVEPVKKIFEYGSDDDNQLKKAIEVLNEKLGVKP